MPDLHISEDVRQLLGPEGVARGTEMPWATGTCAHCARPLDGRVNLAVRTDGQLFHIVYVHAGCGPSEVIPTAQLQPAAETDMRMTAAVLDHGGADLPALVAETEVKSYAYEPGRDLVDLLISHLLGQGFTLTSRFRKAPAAVPDWAGVLLRDHGPAGEDQLLVLEPDGTVFFRGSVDLPAGWLDHAVRYSWAVLYVGDVGLHQLPDDAKTRTTAMRGAAQAGRLVGARIAVGGPPESSSPQPATGDPEE